MIFRGEAREDRASSLFYHIPPGDKIFDSFSGRDKFLITPRFLLIVLFQKARYAFTIERKTYR